MGFCQDCEIAEATGFFSELWRNYLRKLWNQGKDHDTVEIAEVMAGGSSGLIDAELGECVQLLDTATKVVQHRTQEGAVSLYVTWRPGQGGCSLDDSVLGV